VIDQETLDERRLGLASEALSTDGSLVRVVGSLGCASEEEALRCVARSLGLEFVDLAKVSVDHAVIESFPTRLTHRYGVFPLAEDAVTGAIVVATGNPFDLHGVDAVASALGRSVRPVVAQSVDLAKLIKSHLGLGAETVDGLLAQREEQAEGSVEVLEEIDWDRTEASEMAQEASVVRLVNEILAEAVEARASDIHLEAQSAGMRIRYRIDGVLQVQPAPPEINHFQAAIISRLKIMSHLNIAEKRLPQDGRIKVRISGREIDIRVSIIPMLHGEGIVMRLLDKERMDFSLRGVGMADDVLAAFRQLIRLPHGIILVTGPTGSGKTTTLYSALNEIKSDETKIITTEDPIEYQLDGINQIQVHAKIGLTFGASLRSILRHDPEIVLVGEIRDLETAENAVQASLTGHLVFSTLHTNDAAGAFMRLIDMGVEPYLVGSTVEGVLAQRLVRSLCPECRTEWRPSADDLPADFPYDVWMQSDVPLYRAAGCRACRGLGYTGRTGIYELLIAGEEIRHLAMERCGSHVLKQAALRAGLRTLRHDGWSKALEGRTTVDEVLRVTKAD
jgi:general secretion pathway protein E/type IV pilus assembly protein PilB